MTDKRRSLLFLFRPDPFRWRDLFAEIGLRSGSVGERGGGGTANVYSGLSALISLELQTCMRSGIHAFWYVKSP